MVLQRKFHQTSLKVIVSGIVGFVLGLSLAELLFSVNAITSFLDIIPLHIAMTMRIIVTIGAAYLGVAIAIDLVAAYPAYPKKKYYHAIFEKFDQKNGGFVPTWNWAAFLFGIFWYFVKGIWAKGLLMILFALFTSGIGIPILWLYCAVFGNWDYYLANRRGTQLWSIGAFQSSVQGVTGRTKRCPHCAEFIQEMAKACRYCGRDVPPTQATPEPP